MELLGKRIGFGLTGSHCTYEEVMPQIECLIEAGADVIPVVSAAVKDTDTRFGKGLDWVKKLEEITGNEIVDSIKLAEPFGPSRPLDCMVIAPLTGSSLSKLARAQSDTAVLMAAKATMRNLGPIVLAISTNDGLGLSGENMMKLMTVKNIYFVPFGQDDPVKKPNSIVARMDNLLDTVVSALNGRQIQPVLIERFLDFK